MALTRLQEAWNGQSGESVAQAFVPDGVRVQHVSQSRRRPRPHHRRGRSHRKAVNTLGPGEAERQGQIRIAAGRIKDYARILSGDQARGLVLEDSESALKAVVESRAEADEDA